MITKLITYTPTPELICGEAAAICTDSTKPGKSLESAIESGHYSILEHAYFTFEVIGLSRAALAQLTRHRLASFSVKGQRYCKSGDDYVIPETISNSHHLADFIKVYDQCKNVYDKMISDGILKEDARYILPQATSTSLIITMNARELLHFFELRCCNRAQWEIRELADLMLVDCKIVAPTIFEKAGPPCVCGQCHEKRPCGHPRKANEWADWDEDELS